MITLKLVIQQANLSTLDGDGNSITFYILQLSEKKRQIGNLKVMPTAEGLRVFEKISVKYQTVFTEVQRNEWIEKLNKECREISNKLTKLNEGVEVTLPFDPSKI
jgi:hypothetical protein